MKTCLLAHRCFKEILRDPLTLFFGIAFPLILLGLLSAIQTHVPTPMFEISLLAPGIALFGQSFLTLFTALMIAKDRSTALIHRLMASPLKPAEFLLGYTLSMIPLGLMQGLLCFIAGGLMGMPLDHVCLGMIVLLPICFLFIFLGLIFGLLLNDKQVGGICGALMTNLTAWLSGIWFDVKLVGHGFETIANLLPFVHGVKWLQSAMGGDISCPHGWIPMAYTLLAGMMGTWLFQKKMRRG